MSISYYDVLVDYEALVNQVNEGFTSIRGAPRLQQSRAYSSIYLRFTWASRHTQEKHSKLHHAEKYRGTHRH